GTGAAGVSEAGPSATTTMRDPSSGREDATEAPIPANDRGTHTPARSRNHQPSRAASGTSASAPAAGADCPPTGTATPQRTSEDRTSPPVRSARSGPRTSTPVALWAPCRTISTVSATAPADSAAAAPDSSGTRAGAPGTRTTEVLTPGNPTDLP